MTNSELDRRIQECAAVVNAVVDDLAAGEPTLEQAVALGALGVCLNALHMLHTAREIERVSPEQRSFAYDVSSAYPHRDDEAAQQQDALLAAEMLEDKS